MGAAVRDLADRVASADLDPAALEAILVRIEGLSQTLPAVAGGESHFARTLQGPPAGRGRHPLEAGSGVVFPAVGFLPVGQDRLEMTTTFGPSWEGPPGLVHGGHLAMAFDIAMSALAARVVGHTVTRTLTVRYLKPVRLGEALRIAVSVEGQEELGGRRLLDLRGELSVSDRRRARASAQFASVEPPPG